MTIRIVAHMTVKPGVDRARFKAVVDDIMAAVRREEAGGTTVFEYHASGPEGTSLLVHEVYADLDAYLAHGKHMAKVAGDIMDMITIDWGHITGPLPADVAARITASGWSHYYGYPFADIAKG